MTKRMKLILLGLWVALVPFFGLPGSWKNWIIAFTGIVIALISYFHGKDQPLI